MFYKQQSLCLFNKVNLTITLANCLRCWLFVMPCYYSATQVFINSYSSLFKVQSETRGFDVLIYQLVRLVWRLHPNTDDFMRWMTLNVKKFSVDKSFRKLITHLASFVSYLGNTLIPASDDLSLANPELERLATVPGGVKLLSVGQSACVVHHNSLSRLGVG